MSKQTTEKSFYNPKHTKIVERNKKEIFKLNDITHYLEQKTKNDQPIVFPMNFLHDSRFPTLSEKNRCERFTKIFSDFKYYLENNEDNEIQIAKEVR